MFSNYEEAKSYRSRFIKNHGKYERMLVSIRRHGIRIELYRRDPGGMKPMETVLVLVDDLDRKEPVPFLQKSMAQKYRYFREAFFWFRESCKHYGIKGVDLDRAIKSIRAMDID